MPTSSAEYKKDPNAVLDYPFDWSDWLNTGEAIVTSDFTVSAGITIDSETTAATYTIVWLSGGTENGNYRVTNRITTSQDRTDDRSIIIQVTSR